MKVSFWQIMRMRLFGYVEVDGVIYTDCPSHGFTRAIIHGWHGNIDCEKCLKKMVKRFEEESGFEDA